jgi:hypothetical protein
MKFQNVTSAVLTEKEALIIKGTYQKGFQVSKEKNLKKTFWRNFPLKG